MRFEWTTEFELDYPELDREHREMFTVLQEVEKAAAAGRRGRCAALVTSLIGFCKRHFSREEALMAETGYPDREAHAAHHRDLLNQAWSLLAASRHAAETGDIELCRQQAWDFIKTGIIEGDRPFTEFLHARTRAAE